MHRPATEVALPPMSTHMYTFSATEPQYISSRVPNQGWIYVSSQNTPLGTNRSNCTLGNVDPLALGMARIKILGFATYWNVPNVNPRNNVISFWSSNTGAPPGGTLHTTAPLIERWYDITVPADVTALTTDILNKMNALAGASGLIFGVTPSFGPQTFDLTALGGTYVMDARSSAVAKGQQMYGFPVEEPTAASLSASKQLGSMNFAYTQYIDICSNTLSRWDKMQSNSTGSTNPIIMRAYAGGQHWGLQFQDLSAHPIELSWKADEPLTYFDIKMYDQNGDPLYVPDNGKRFIWQLSMLAEM